MCLNLYRDLMTIGRCEKIHDKVIALAIMPNNSFEMVLAYPYLAF